MLDKSNNERLLLLAIGFKGGINPVRPVNGISQEDKAQDNALVPKSPVA